MRRRRPKTALLQVVPQRHARRHIDGKSNRAGLARLLALENEDAGDADRDKSHPGGRPEGESSRLRSNLMRCFFRFSLAEERPVAALWQFDNQRVLLSVAGIVVAQAGAQSDRLGANDGVRFES